MYGLALPTAATILLLMTATAMALECPVPAGIADQAQAAAIDKILPDGVDLEAPQALQSAVFELKQAGIADDVILDNLIAAQCASVNTLPGVSDDDKTQRVQAFSTEADTAVFGGN